MLEKMLKKKTFRIFLATLVWMWFILGFINIKAWAFIAAIVICLVILYAGVIVTYTFIQENT